MFGNSRGETCPLAVRRPALRPRAALLVLAVVGLAGCSGPAIPGNAAAAPGSATPTRTASGVTELGPQSGDARLAAAQKLPGGTPVTIELDGEGETDRSKWPDACTLVTKDQIKAIVPGDYELVAEGAGPGASSRDGSGTSSKPTECSWKLGAGESNVSKITVSLFDQNSLMPGIFTDKVARAKADGGPQYEGLPDGTRCVWDLGNLDCLHGKWRFFVSGVVWNPDSPTDRTTPTAPSSSRSGSSPSARWSARC